jgi:hypothetical protein
MDPVAHFIKTFFRCQRRLGELLLWRLQPIRGLIEADIEHLPAERTPSAPVGVTEKVDRNR